MAHEELHDVPKDYHFIQKAFSEVLFCLLVMMNVALLLMVFARRNYQPLKIRNWILTMIQLISLSSLEIILIIRFLMGWDKFPCFLFRLSGFLFLPFIMFPYVFKALRTYFVFRLSVVKGNYRPHFTNSSKNSWLKNLVVSKWSKDTLLNSQFEGSVRVQSIDDKMDFLSENLSKKHRFVKWFKFILRDRFLYLFLVLLFVGSMAMFTLEFIDSRTFSQGCRRSNYGIAVFCLYGWLNLLCILCLSIFLRKIRERFYLRLESIFAVFIFSLMMISITVLFLVPHVVLDYFPIVWVLCICLQLDTCFTWFMMLLTLKSSYGFRWTEDTKEVPTELKKLLNHTVGLRFFLEYSEIEFSSENVHFWLDVQYFKSRKDAETRKHVGNQISEMYFSPNSAMELNIPSHVKSTILDNKKDLSDKNVFDQVMFAIETNMLDTYSRFVLHPMFEKMTVAIEDLQVRDRQFSLS